LNGAARLLSTVAGGSARLAETQIRDQEVSLEPGDQILIEAGASYDLHNAGASATTALVAAILPNLGTASVVVGKPIPAASASEALSMPGLEVGSTAIGATGLTSGGALSSALFWTPTSANSAGSIWPAGVAVTSLAAERIPPAARPLSGHVRITVDRLVLSPEQHGVATLAGQTVLAVESGRGIVGDFQEPRAEAAPIGKVSVVSPGEAISRAAGERLVARNIDAAPLAVLVVTLSPAASPATTGGQRTE
jgi:mannose-6-phosphate isomerase-like protein (cupin superfamily)